MSRLVVGKNRKSAPIILTKDLWGYKWLIANDARPTANDVGLTTNDEFWFLRY